MASKPDKTENPASRPSPTGSWRDEPYRRMVEEIRDYAVFLLGHGRTRGQLEPGGPAHKGVQARGNHRAALLHVLSAVRDRQALAATRAGDRRALGPLRGRGLACAQGRRALLGQRRDHRDPQSGRAAPRVLQDHPRPHRAARERGAVASERGALPNARGGRAGICNLPARSVGARRDVERGSAAHQRLRSRRDHRPPFLGVLSVRSKGAQLAPARAGGGGAPRTLRGRGAGACARTAPASGPT
jgi:hypothetical protein